MVPPICILLQTTLLPTDDDWNIWRFSLLQTYLQSLTDEAGRPLYVVTARDRHPDGSGNDPVLSHLGDSDFDQLWLFALDTGDGLSPQDCAGILAFHQRGGGILTTRDHQDMGLSMCALGQLGALHYFQTQQQDPDQSRHCMDDIHTPTISWPNYHSGRNGDYQTIQPVAPLHDLLRRSDVPAGRIELFPAHPHEGGIGLPEGMTHGRVIATGISQVSGRSFNLAIALEHISDDQGRLLGRVVAQSTFHHFADYNWDVGQGCPSFVTEPPGDGMQENPQALSDIHAYVRNLAQWLSPAPMPQAAAYAEIMGQQGI